MINDECVVCHKEGSDRILNHLVWNGNLFDDVCVFRGRAGEECFANHQCYWAEANILKPDNIQFFVNKFTVNILKAVNSQSFVMKSTL